MRIYYILSLFFVIPNIVYAQKDTTKSKLWYGHFELAGNGGAYSFSAELVNVSGNISKGGRFGLSFLPDDIASDPFVSGFYERNFIFTDKKVRPELGVGITILYFYNGQKNWNSNYYYLGSSNDYYVESFLTLRLGFRFNIDNKYPFRFALIPVLVFNESDYRFADSKNILGTVGISIGGLIN